MTTLLALGLILTIVLMVVLVIKLGRNTQRQADAMVQAIRTLQARQRKRDHWQQRGFKPSVANKGSVDPQGGDSRE